MGKIHLAMLATLHLTTWLPKLLYIVDTLTPADNDVVPLDVTSPDGVILTSPFPFNLICPIDPSVKSIKTKVINFVEKQNALLI
jgi:hypothetical protein